MSKHLVLAAAGLCIGGIWSAAAPAADITWQQPSSTTGQAADVSTTGSLVAASSNNPASPTVNGVHFVNQGPGIAYGGFQGLSYTGHAFTPSGFGPGMTALVGGSAYGNGPATVTLQGLTVGRHYQVQLFMPTWDFNWATHFTGGANTSAYVNAANSQPNGSGPATARPQFIVGTFVADATSQVIGVEGAPHDPHYDVLAAVQVRDVSRPHGGGTLTVRKTIQVNGPIPPPGHPAFTANVSCSPGGPNASLPLTDQNGYQNVATGIGVGESCTVTEVPPDVPAELARRGCHWSTSYPNGQTTRIGDQRTNQTDIVNTWSCKGGGGNGTLHVVKRVVADGSIPPPNASVFMANVSCQPGGPAVTLELSNENGYQNTATGLNDGSSCTVTEQAPVVPPEYARRGCRWETSYTNGQRFRIGGVKADEAVIVNLWTCKPIDLNGARARIR